MDTGRNAGSEGRGTKDTRENGLEVLARAARLKGLPRRFSWPRPKLPMVPITNCRRQAWANEHHERLPA